MTKSAPSMLSLLTRIYRRQIEIDRKLSGATKRVRSRSRDTHGYEGHDG